VIHYNCRSHEGPWHLPDRNHPQRPFLIHQPQQCPRRLPPRACQRGSSCSSFRASDLRQRHQAACRSRSATRNRGSPDCAVPIRSPAPRIARSSSAMRKPSSVSRIVVSRRSPGLVQRRLVQQETGRLPPIARPDPAPQLVKLRQAERLGLLDHHDRGIRHVRRPPRSPWSPPGPRSRPPRSAPSRRPSRPAASGRAQAPPDRQRGAQDAKPLLGAGGNRPPRIPRPGGRPNRPAALQPRPCADAPPPRPAARTPPAPCVIGFRPAAFVQHRQVHVAMRRQRQAARDRRRRHHQHIAAAPLAPSSIRCATPKRCCSSTTASRRSWNATSF
jgi:hypothetical protein